MMLMLQYQINVDIQNMPLYSISIHPYYTYSVTSMSNNLKMEGMGCIIH